MGAGPAGAACALSLAASGLRIAVLDKATFPRDKICGDALSVDVVNQLDRLSPALSEEFEEFARKTPSYGVRIIAPSLQHIDIPFEKDGRQQCGYVCSRMDFDHMLFRHMKAIKGISVFENTTVQAIAMKAGAVELQLQREAISAGMVVGADGAQSMVARQLAGQRMQRRHHSAGLRMYFENVGGFNDGNFIELYFLKDILPGYLWVFPLSGGRANVGIGMLSSVAAEKHSSLRETMLTHLSECPGLSERFRDAKALERPRGFGLPLGSIRRPLSGERYLLTGDAAGLIDPFSGEGIGNALRSGRFAAAHIAQCFQHQDFSAHFNKAYDRAIYKAMMPELRLSHHMQKLSRYSSLLNFVVKKAGQNPAVHETLVKALAHVEVKSLLLNPKFYLQLLMGGYRL
jgi:geranylgeranyl reductase family protein